MNPPARYLLGPGPSPVEPSVLAAMTKPVLSQEDPHLDRILDEVGEGLRGVFRTGNRLTFLLPATGAAPTEAAMANLVEDNDPVVVAVTGEFGRRMAEIARRAGGRVTEVVAPLGKAADPEEIGQVARQRGAKVVGVVHADASTGVRQPLEELKAAIGDDRFLVVDAAASLAGIPLEVDAWDIDVCFSATEECLSVPPGLAPVTVSRRAEQALRKRSSPIRSWFFDLGRIAAEANAQRPFLLPVSLVYGLHEGLRIVQREGMERRWERHAETGAFLQDALEEMGFEIVASLPHRLPHLTVTRMPAGVDDDIRGVLLEEFDIALGGGLGELAGQVWRIGLMGFGARREHALRLLQALRALLSMPGGPRGRR